MVILLLGMTRKWTGAWGATSLKATHWSSWWRNSAGMEPSRILSKIVPGLSWENCLLLWVIRTCIHIEGPDMNYVIGMYLFWQSWHLSLVTLLYDIRSPNRQIPRKPLHFYSDFTYNKSTRLLLNLNFEFPVCWHFVLSWPFEVHFMSLLTKWNIRKYIDEWKSSGDAPIYIY